METFAVMAFFGLGLSVLVMLAHRYATVTREGWALVTIVFGDRLGLAGRSEHVHACGTCRCASRGSGSR